MPCFNHINPGSEFSSVHVCMHGPHSFLTLFILLCTHKLMLSMMLSAVDAKDAVKGAASKAAAGAQRMAGLEPKQGTHMLLYSSPLSS